MKRYVLISVILFLNAINVVFAQKTDKEKSDSEDSYILMDVSYMNDAVFMGRRDSITAPYLLPSIGYYDKSGLFADATVSYLTSSAEQRVDLFYLTGGYLFDSNNWSGGVSGTAYFYNEESYNVQSEVVADITGLVSYDFKLLELSVYASSYFNKNSSPDIFLGFIADHTFRAFDDQMLFAPRFSVYAGSQYFYEEYYTTSRLGNRKSSSSGQGSGPGGSMDSGTEVTAVQIAEASEFNVLNMELSFPFQYHLDQFILSFTPTWAFPQTSATLTTDTGTFEEDLDSVFYWSVGLSYWFKTNKKN
ncbi:hypothetical protein [[Muricauda] lutisoli]|uniref:DUF481 domain-containing protein n=1 Tax=[Muricauda] lutisoli TaxID=2816035 RepID=A0ABS3EV87_9FLAO|nr:hypothetical protein [[Muricauda] lutisoli]MBO0330156.1 hypothetical protein [[Muricauda] lutisoli]